MDPNQEVITDGQAVSMGKYLSLDRQQKNKNDLGDIKDLGHYRNVKIANVLVTFNLISVTQKIFKNKLYLTKYQSNAMESPNSYD